MSKKIDGTRWEVIIQEDPETGDLLLPLPPEMLESLGWDEGDVIKWISRDNTSWALQREEGSKASDGVLPEAYVGPGISNPPEIQE